jgi:hypothetical protein
MVILKRIRPAAGPSVPHPLWLLIQPKGIKAKLKKIKNSSLSMGVRVGRKQPL